MPMNMEPTMFIMLIVGAVIVGMVIMLLMAYMVSHTAATIIWAKMLQKKNLVRKIYPGSRREKLYIPKKSTPDDIFIVENGKIDMIDGAMKTEFGSTMVDGIRIHTGMAGDMAPMGPEAATSATYMVKAAKDSSKYPYLSQIRESHKISDLLACDMESIERKARKYVVLNTANKTKEDVKREKEEAVTALVKEVTMLRGDMASHLYPVDYITAINAVLNPVVKGVVELIDIYLQKKNEDDLKKKMNMLQMGMVFAGIIGAIAISAIAIYRFIGN
jgi:hypothetical protein